MLAHIPHVDVSRDAAKEYQLFKDIDKMYKQLFPCGSARIRPFLNLSGKVFPGRFWGTFF